MIASEGEGETGEVSKEGEKGGQFAYTYYCQERIKKFLRDSVRTYVSKGNRLAPQGQREKGGVMSLGTDK